MNFIRIGDHVINLINVEYIIRDGDKVMIFFIGSESDFISVDIPFDELCTMINVRGRSYGI